MSIDQSQSEPLLLPQGRFLHPSHRTRPEQILGLSIYLSICLGFELLTNLTGQFFGTLYYTSLALSMWTLWRRHSLRVLKLELSVFLSQFLFQAAWSISHEILLSLVALLLLWCTTLLATLLFWKKERLSGALLLFPLLWIFYLAGLNMVACISNP